MKNALIIAVLFLASVCRAQSESWTDSRTCFRLTERTLLVTRDSGNTWQTINSNVERINGVQYYCGFNSQSEYLYFRNDSVGMVLGGYDCTYSYRAVYFLTRDGGRHWTHNVLPYDYSAPATPQTFVYVDNDLWLHALGNKLYKGVGLGQQWKEIILPVRENGDYPVLLKFADRNNGNITFKRKGLPDLVLYSSDGGETWNNKSAK